ncbi:MAG: phosphate ABC transporter substrate-binding protein PstS [Gammaproteobacteria bacterium]|jgi:phosphate transport system substrate-binding protein
MLKFNKVLPYALGAGMVIASAVTSASAMAETLNGAGSTAIYPVLSDWAVAYHKMNGTAVNYQAIGSGGGIKQIKSKTVEFAASDKPLTHDVLAENNMVQFPGIIIGITPVVNLPHIKAGQIVLDGKTLADIYLGKITEWDSTAIKRLNPNLKLPHMKITTVHRADGSGTTFNFANYLSKVSSQWKDQVGADTAISWPQANGVGGKGNAGVATYVQRIKGSIGYVEFAYAMQNKLTYTRMKNQAGKIVRPELKTFQAAAANANYGKSQDFYLILTNQPGARSWPITASTWLLMRKDTAKAMNAKVLKFCSWFLDHGQSYAEKLDYVPLPKSTVAQIKSYWKKELGI